MLTALRTGGLESPHQGGHRKAQHTRLGACLIRGAPFFRGTRGTRYHKHLPLGKPPNGTACPYEAPGRPTLPTGLHSGESGYHAFVGGAPVRDLLYPTHLEHPAQPAHAK